MNNEKEKTFVDLLSNSTKDHNKAEKDTKELENNKKKITFDNLLDKSNSKEESPKKTLTFDNLLDKSSLKDGNHKEENNAKTIFPSPLQEANDNSVSQGKNNNSLNLSKKENLPKEIFSPIKEKNNPVNIEIKEDNNFLNLGKETKTILSNPFLDSSNDLANQEKSNNSLSKKKETKKEKNSVNSEVKEDNSSLNLKTKEENNILDSEKNKIKSSTQEATNNLFFTNNENSSSKGNTAPLTSEEDTPLSSKEPPSNSLKDESSPFFQDETTTDESMSFLQTKLNLIENDQSPKKTNQLDLSHTKHYNVKIVKKKEPLFKFILGVISYAIFIWLLLIGVALLIYVLDIKIRAAKGDNSSPTYGAYVVLTGSMLPDIQVYDVVVTKKVPAESLNEGDIITFSSADTRFLGYIITHRIIKKNPSNETSGYTFQTKGDNNNVADSALVPESNIYGKVILKIPKLGYLQKFLASDGGWIIVILIPCLTVISYDVVKLIKGLKRKKYKNIKVQSR